MLRDGERWELAQSANNSSWWNVHIKGQVILSTPNKETAVLVAALPELVEALEKIRDMEGHSNTIEDASYLAADALRKAGLV